MAELILERSLRLELRSQAHHLNVGVLMGEKGLTDAVMKEIDRALSDHGLVKVHAVGDDREEREEMYVTIADKLGAARIQAIGKMLVFYRPVDEEKKAAKSEKPVRILMAKADPGARGVKKPQTAADKKKASKAPKSRKEVKRIMAARSHAKRGTKKSSLG